MQTARASVRLFLILAVAVPATLAGCARNTGSSAGPRVGVPTDPQEALARLKVANDLKGIALSLHNFRDTNNRLPPVDGEKDPKVPELAGLSWRAYILPFMDTDTNQVREGEVYRRLLQGRYPPAKNAGPSERWNRPELASLQLAPYSCPVPGKTAKPWLTFYRVFVGGGAAFEPGKKMDLKPESFPDGRDKTILVVEAGEAVPWPKPEELPYDPAKPLPKLGGTFPDGFYAAFADAKVRFIPRDTDERTIRAMITRNGGEQVELPPEVDTEALRQAAGRK